LFPFLCSFALNLYLSIQVYIYILYIMHSSLCICTSFSILAIYYIFLSYPLHAFSLLRYCVLDVHAEAFYYIYNTRTQKLLALELGMYLVFCFFSMFTSTVAAAEETRGKTRTLSLSYMYINNSLCRSQYG